MSRKFLLTFIVLSAGWLQAAAQQIIKGQLKDGATNEPLIGAHVVLKGTTRGASTDLDGKFEILYQGKYPVTLEAAFLGYKQKELVLQEAPGYLELTLSAADDDLQEVLVTSRRRKEELQSVPIPITVLGKSQIDNTISFSVNRVKEMVPSVQLYSSNPRNTTLNIRGLGSTFGLTNDGIDPGVGFYVDGVYYARPAATTIDFIDIDQIEVLRGPQGTLFGKNTTAGTFNVTTRKPSFRSGGTFELSYGNYAFVQAKGSVTGPIIKNKLAARLSFTGTKRDGVLFNATTDKHTNTMNNVGFRGQLLFTPSDKVEIIMAADNTIQRPDGYAQVLAGVAPTQRAEYRQFENIIKDLNYQPASRNPFDRVIDQDTKWQSNQDMGGVSLNADIHIGNSKLTSTTAWRYWNWDPSNDRDFTGLQALRLSQAPSKHQQWSQEVRYAGGFNKKLSGVIGLFGFYQALDPDGAHTEESGKDQWRFSQNTSSELWATPGLLDGYGIKTYPKFRNFSGALFGQIDWKITSKLRLLPGIRLNYDEKSVDFRRETYGGLQTEDPALKAIKSAVYNNQAFSAKKDDFNVSGQITAQYELHPKIRTFATFALSYKPVGLNLGGLPNANGQPMVELAVLKPEQVQHYELGFKTEPVKNGILNLTFFNTQITDYQTAVQTADLSVNRGYLSNAEKVQVYGGEVDASYRFKKYFVFNAAVNYTEGKYVSFKNAPPPLEETGGPTFKDISGGQLPGISKWAATMGIETAIDATFLGSKGDFFFGIDGFYRSDFSSSPTPSKYMMVEGYTVLNARLGWRANEGTTIFVWGRNIADTEYFEQLLPGAGNAGHYAAVLGDPKTYGITLRYNLP